MEELIGASRAYAGKAADERVEAGRRLRELALQLPAGAVASLGVESGAPTVSQALITAAPCRIQARMRLHAPSRPRPLSPRPAGRCARAAGGHAAGAGRRRVGAGRQQGGCAAAAALQARGLQAAARRGGPVGAGGGRPGVGAGGGAGWRGQPRGGLRGGCCPLPWG